MIIPAHEPNAGIPPDSRLRSGSATSKAVASFHIVVDSPPGITSPSTAASSSGRRTQMLHDVPLQREYPDDRCRPHDRTSVTHPTLTSRVVTTANPARTPRQ